MRTITAILIFLACGVLHGAELGSPEDANDGAWVTAGNTNYMTLQSNVYVCVKLSANLNNVSGATYHTIPLDSIVEDERGLWDTNTYGMSFPDETFFGRYLVAWEFQNQSVASGKYYYFMAMPNRGYSCIKRDYQVPVAYNPRTATSATVVVVDSTNDVIYLRFVTDDLGGTADILATDSRVHIVRIRGL